MKRSQMLSELQSTIRYLRDCPISDDAGAKHLLEKLELLGMKPPVVPTYTEDGRLWNHMSQWEKE